METKQALSALSALCQETRLKVFKLLIEYGKSGVPAGALSKELDIPHNTLSFHLSHLSNAGLVSSVRDARSIIYSANCDAIEELIGYLGENCCSREAVSADCGTLCKPPSKKGKLLVKTVLVLCTGNSCRSIIAEALINHLGAEKYKAFSAGSKPTGKVHPLAIKTLTSNGIPVPSPRSKSWDEFTDSEIDIVITVCDNAVGEACPIFLGEQKKLHWSTPDPATATGSEQEIFDAFTEVFLLLKSRIEELVRDA